MKLTMIDSESSGFKLYNGDARDVCEHHDIKANCIVTDPPYKLEKGGATAGGLHERIGGDAYNNQGSIVDCDIEWHEIMEICYNNMGRGHAYVMSNNRHVQDMLTEAELAGFYFHNLLIWDKRSATPNRWYMKNCEFIGFLSRGKAININDCGSKQLIAYPQIDETDHPTEKPVALMEHFILNSTKPGDTVFDPFMGTGTTGVAALKAGRKFIGIERDPRWYHVAVERITSAAKHHQSCLFE